MKRFANQAFRDVLAYPRTVLEKQRDGAHVGVRYEKSWDDGFGARGWKANAAVGDPVILASTRETGERILTSVFVHDILDHLLSGFGISGHRSEAMALIQLQQRTGSDPSPDYAQMVREDILGGGVNGEPLTTFLPRDLRSLMPAESGLSDREMMDALRERLGEKRLIARLTSHFHDLGRAGKPHARESWKKLGLNAQKQSAIGHALQRALDEADRFAETTGAEKLEASIFVGNEYCTLAIRQSSLPESVFRASVNRQDECIASSVQ